MDYYHQEQVMQIAQTLAGFSAGEADILRRAMGKKRAELEKQKERFVSGAIKKELKRSSKLYFYKNRTLRRIWIQQKSCCSICLNIFSDWIFKNISQEDFIAATMSTELANTGKLREFVEELKKLNVEVVRPSINNCFADFRADKNKILYGLGAIKNVGFEAISNIVNEREKNGPFKSIDDFINRSNPKDVNKLQLEGMVKSGVFDELEKNRKKIFESIPKIIQTIKFRYEEKTNNQSNLFGDSESIKEDSFKYVCSDSWSRKELLFEEFKSLGFYISDHPLNIYSNIFKNLNIKSYKEFVENSKTESLVAGTIMSIQEKSIKGTHSLL